MIRRDEVYKIGKLGKPHGVKGEITFAITDDVFDRVDAEYLVLDIDGILVPFYLEEYRFKNDENVITFRSRHFEKEVEGGIINTLQSTYQLSAYGIYQLKTDDFCPGHVLTIAIRKVAWKKDLATGIVASLLLGIDILKFHEYILIPASNDLIEEVNAEKKEIRMAIPEGLLDL